MMLPYTRWFILLSTLLVSACSEPPESLQAAQKAMAIESHEECHLCGMIIDGFPGPKGQLYERGEQESFKFCSTRDMFAYLLDPEHQHAIQTAYVHDMATTHWNNPDDEIFIDARKAWYVVGHNKKGAMGPTLASFADENVANAFAQQYGGHIIDFSGINQKLLLNME